MVETDDQGKADVPAGSQVYVTADDYAPGVIEVGETDQGLVLEPLAPWMVLNPGRGLGGLAVGPVVIGDWRDDMSLTSIDSSVSLNGGTPIPQVLDKSQVDRERDFEFDFIGTGVQIGLGLPRIPFCGAKLYPAIHGTIGDAELEFDNLGPPGTNSYFEADGLFFGAGADLVLLPCVECPAFLGVAYDFRRFSSDDTTHRFDLPSGVIALSDSTRIDYQQQNLTIRGGTSFFDNHFSPHLGIQLSWTELEVDATTNILVPSTPTSQMQGRVNRFQLEPETLIHGVAGFDLRAPRNLPFFLRGQTAFTDDDVSVLGVLTVVFDTQMVRRALIQ